MKKKYKKMYLKRVCTMVLVSSVLFTQIMNFKTQLSFADDKIEDMHIREEENGKIESDNFEIENNKDTSLELENTNQEEKDKLISAIELLEKQITSVKNIEIDREILLKSEETLKAAKDLLEKTNVSSEDIEKMIEECRSAENALSELQAPKAEETIEPRSQGVQTRSASLDNTSGIAYLGDSERERGLVASTLDIEKNIDYSNHSINWTVTLYAPDGTWNKGTKVRLWMPKYENLSNFTKTDKNGSKGYGNIGFSRYDYPENDFNKRFKNLSDDASNNQALSNDLNYMLQKARISHVLEDLDIELPNKTSMSYTFTTSHDVNTDLNKVSLGVSIQNRTDNYRRTLLRGSFGLANRHELQKPQPIYVKNKNRLTDAEKAKVKNKILSKTRAYYESKNMTDEIRQLNRANKANRIKINDDGSAIISWEDGTQSSLNNPSDYIKQEAPTIEVDNIGQKVLEDKEIKSINITTRGVSSGKLSIANDKPAWLTFTPSTDGLSGQLSGKPSVSDWKEEKQRTFEVKINLENDNGNTISKNVSIIVSRNTESIPPPVGVNERGYEIPSIILTLGLLASISVLLKLRKEV